MEKITDFNYVKKYFCSKCDTFHRKYYTKDGKRKKAKKFQEHKEFAYLLNSTELWHYQFKRNWHNNARYQARTGKPVGL